MMDENIDTLQEMDYASIRTQLEMGLAMIDEQILAMEQAAMLEGFGISMEEFSSMSAEEQQAILDELGIVMEDQKQTESTSGSKKEYTTADVAAGGKYKVRIGDGRLNNYWLYYENGKLVKIVDYKSGARDFSLEELYYGLSMQLAVYMTAVPRGPQEIPRLLHGCRFHQRFYPTSLILPPALPLLYPWQ